MAGSGDIHPPPSVRSVPGETNPSGGRRPGEHGGVILHGRYVQLEPLDLHHAPDLLAAATEDRASYGFTAVPDSPAAAEAYVAAILHDAQRGTAVPFVHRRLDRGQICGATRFLNIERWSGYPEPAVVEIGGTWLAASAQRTPINTEAKLLMLTQAFERWTVQRLWIKTDARNERSRRAIERLGATFEGVLRNFQPAQGRPGPRDTAVYSILPEEWPSRRAALRARLAPPG
jgi:RimJ/RimL family protein N-acetyltransferase